MEKIDFKNKPDRTTPISAENLNKLQDNIEKEIKDKQGVKELLGTTAEPINANDIKAIGVYRISGEHTNFFDDRTAAFILYVTLDGEKLIQSVILEEGLYSRSATYTIVGEEISWNFSEWKFRGGRKEVGYANEELEGTEKILIEDGDFDGVPVNEVVTMETITNDNGTAIKFSDGTMICYKDISGVVNISNASGSGYYGTLSVDSLFPQEFVEIPIISTGLRNTEWVMASSVTATATQITKIIILSLKSDGSKNVHVNVIAIGKWK